MSNCKIYVPNRPLFIRVVKTCITFPKGITSIQDISFSKSQISSLTIQLNFSPLLHVQTKNDSVQYSQLNKMTKPLQTTMSCKCVYMLYATQRQVSLRTTRFDFLDIEWKYNTLYN